MFDGEKLFVAVGVVVGVKAFGFIAKGGRRAVGTVVGLKVLVLEGTGIGFSVGGPVQVLRVSYTNWY